MTRIALLWNAPCRLVDLSVRCEPYVEGLREAGIDALTLCPTGMEIGYPYPVHCFERERELADPRFWQAIGCEAMVIISWHRMTEIQHAARTAGLKVLALGDSDGQIASVRFHPWKTFRLMALRQPTVRGKLGAAKHWLRRFLRSGIEHDSLVENTAAANVFTLPGQGPVKEFRSLLHRLGAGQLTEQVVWLPYPIPNVFCTAPVARDRPDRIIAVGRWDWWDSHQKNPQLLERAIRQSASIRPHTEFIVVGKGAEARFAHLARQVPATRVLGIQPRERVRELMAGCRSIIYPSRWEGSPVTANEMLALGGTVIGTPIPSLSEITADDGFGRVSKSHSASTLATAIADEMTAWDAGKRDPVTIACHWRGIVSPRAVAQRIIGLLSLGFCQGMRPVLV